MVRMQEDTKRIQPTRQCVSKNGSVFIDRSG